MSKFGGTHNKHSLLLLLSGFSRVRLCATPQMAAHKAPVPGILQARTLEWVAISFSNAGKWKVKVKPLSRVRLLATPWTAAHQAPPSMGFSSQECWSGVPLPSPKHSLGISKSTCRGNLVKELLQVKYESSLSNCHLGTILTCSLVRKLRSHMLWNDDKMFFN